MAFPGFLATLRDFFLSFQPKKESRSMFGAMSLFILSISYILLILWRDVSFLEEMLVEEEDTFLITYFLLKIMAFFFPSILFLVWER